MPNGANFSRINCWSKIGVALIRPSGTGMYAAFSQGEKAVSAAICHRHTCHPRPLGECGMHAGRLSTAGGEGGEGHLLAVTIKC
jgi:hypothetical protein